MRHITILLFLVLAISSCHKKPESTAAMLVTEIAEPAATGATQVPPTKEEYKYDKSGSHEGVNQPLTLSLAKAGYLDAIDKKPDEEPKQTALIKNRVETKEIQKIIKNATVNFQVEKNDSSHDRIARSLSAYEAYFGSDKRSQNSYEIQQIMVIRVPSVNFDKLMDILMKESIYTENKNITADDVTSEFVDIQVRLKSKKEVEKRYMELLSHAQKVSDVLEVENNLRVIREEIESTEGRLKLLKDQVAYSTITLTLTQRVKGETMPEAIFGYRLRESVVNGWQGLLSFALTLVSLWPFLLVLSVFIIWIMIRRRKRAQ